MKGKLNALSHLDKMKLTNGVEVLKTTFYELSKKQKEKATQLINDKELHFNTLFYLMPEIKRCDLYDTLNLRNMMALKISAKILKGKKLVNDTDYFFENREMMYPILKWMLKTGLKDDGYDNDFDEILDTTAAVLVKSYRDKTMLPDIADTIFKRCRKGLYTHDLVWAFFQSRDPYTLRLVAEYLRSKEEADFKMACRLLNHEPSRKLSGKNDKQKHFKAYLSWLKDNYPYLYFTGESFHSTSTPKPFAVDLNAKYLCKTINAYDGALKEPYTETEIQHIRRFNELNAKEKIKLSEASKKIHDQNLRIWNRWMQNPLSKQIETAKTDWGVIE